MLCGHLWTRLLVRYTTERKHFSALGVGAANTMSRNGMNPGLDLKLNLSPPANRQRVESPNRTASPMSPTSTPTSCVSLDVNMMVDGDAGQALQASNSPDAMSMVLVGCPRCLMYVMLSDEEEPKCPKCKSSVLLDFQNHHNSTTATTTAKKRKN